mgnify:CR=1 FL=1
MPQKNTHLVTEIKQLANFLDTHYAAKLNFRNHCYLRIAFDNTVNDKWDAKVAKPFLKYAKNEQLQNVLHLLTTYLDDELLLLSDNEKSLAFRKQFKQMEHIKSPKLF